MQALHAFFRHYLIARQLSDDAHDWQDDLGRGHVNSVAVRILGYHGKLPGTIDLAKQADELRLIMWERVIDEVCDLAYRHLEHARRSLSGAGFASEPFEPLLISLESAMLSAQGKRNEALKFLNALK
jgi:hypothetical protein